jgi:putative protease
LRGFYSPLPEFTIALRLALKNGKVRIPDSDLIQRQAFKHVGGMQMPEETIGKVSDFFARPVVAAIELTATLKLGDRISIKGHTTDLELTVDSMQIDNAPVEEAKAGDSVGVKVSERVRKGDTVYKVVE